MNTLSLPLIIHCSIFDAVNVIMLPDSASQGLQTRPTALTFSWRSVLPENQCTSGVIQTFTVPPYVATYVVINVGGTRIPRNANAPDIRRRRLVGHDACSCALHPGQPIPTGFPTAESSSGQADSSVPTPLGGAAIPSLVKRRAQTRTHGRLGYFIFHAGRAGDAGTIPERLSLPLISFISSPASLRSVTVHTVVSKYK